MIAYRLVFRMMEKFSEISLVTNRVKQGCVTARSTPRMMLSVLLMDGFHDRDTGFPIRYPICGK